MSGSVSFARTYAWILGAMLAATGVIVVAQEATPPAKPAAKTQKRLPAHYKDVVTEQQRAKIYELQASYGEKISKLAEEMKKLTAERDAAMEAVLTPEQKAKVAELRAAAAAKAKEKAAAKPSAEDAPATKSPPEKSSASTTPPADPKAKPTGK